MLSRLARKSLWNRRGTTVLTIISLAISVSLLLAIDHLRREARTSFQSTLSGTDLIVGARTGQLNLLLYSVFRMGSATNNISWESYREIADHPSVKWTIPLSLGDSHRGFRVLGTNGDYFEHYRFGRGQALRLREGRPFEDVYDAVLGYQVARQLEYELGRDIVIGHGIGSTSFSLHEDKPFTVVGILEPTGTPVDQTVHVSLEGIEAIHIDWQGGARRPGRAVTADQARHMDLQPEAITAFLVGLQSRVMTFTLQRQINEYRAEPLLAILPGVALSELWQMLSMVENLLYVISFLVLLATLVGMVTALLASMKERQREMAILRAVGAHPLYLFALVEIEVILLAVAGVLAALVLLTVGLLVAQPLLVSEFGLFISANPFNEFTLLISLLVVGLAALLGTIPAFAAYRRALHDGLAVRV